MPVRTLEDPLIFYWVYRMDSPKYGVAYPADEQDPNAKRALLRRLRQEGRIEDWKELSLVLKDGDFADFQFEVRNLRLCSELMKSVLDQVKGPKDRLQWLPAFMTDVDGHERRRYWVLHFVTQPDLEVDAPLGELSKQPKPFDRNKLINRHVLPHPDPYSTPFFVSSDAHAALHEANCVGLSYERFEC